MDFTGAERYLHFACPYTGPYIGVSINAPINKYKHEMIGVGMVNQQKQVQQETAYSVVVVNVSPSRHRFLPKGDTHTHTHTRESTVATVSLCVHAF